MIVDSQILFHNLRSSLMENVALLLDYSKFNSFMTIKLASCIIILLIIYIHVTALK